MTIQQKQSKDQQPAGKDKQSSDSNESNNLAAISDKANMDSLHAVTAYLLKYKLIDLDSLLPHVRAHRETNIKRRLK